MSNIIREIQCFWCGSFSKENNPVTVSEDVPPRWLTGEKKVKAKNCVPQCENCKIGLSGLDDAVNGYFRYGAEVDLDKVERHTIRINNKGTSARQIILHNNIDYAQSNGSLLLWLRKLLAGLWYKEKGTYYDGGMLFLTPWITFDDKDMYISHIVPSSTFLCDIIFNIDKFLGFNYEIDYQKKIPFCYNFDISKLSNIPKPLHLTRFSIYSRFIGYCLFLPKSLADNPFSFISLYNKPPLYVENWLKGFQFIPSTTVIELVKSLKNISADEAAKRVTVLNK